MSTDIPDVESDDIEEAGEQLGEASSSVDRSLKQKARIGVIATLIALAGGFVTAVVTGIINLSLDIQASANLGFIVEWLGMYFVAFIVIAFTTMLLWAMPGNYIKGVTTAAAALNDDK